MTLVDVVPEGTNWKAVQALLKGEEDLDKMVFDNLALATGAWSESRAKNFWTYTDGWQVHFETSVKADHTGAGDKSTWCFTNTGANEDQGGSQKADGYYCVDWDGPNKQISTIKYKLTADTVAANTTNAWQIGMAITSGNKHIDSTKYFWQERANGTMSTVGNKLSFGWYQPKWQADYYYQENFRLNNKDTIQAKYCDAHLMEDGSTTSSNCADGPAVVLEQSATAIASSAAVFIGAIALLH